MIEVEIDKGIYLDAFQHLLEENDIDIELIWGGRDSGKSRHVGMQLTEEAMALDYLRCLLIKHTHESIKDAQWQMIKDISDEWNVDSLFHFRTSPLGITCLNKNTFLARGMDKPGKIRSISNPSHAWVEEANQTTEEAFINLLTGLRSNNGRVKLFLTFNPEAECSDYTEFWLWKMFFKKHHPEKNFVGELVMKIKINGFDTEVKLKYRSTHVTYHHNPHVTPQRIAFHESLKETNYYWYQVFTLGEWGNKENNSPWAFAFDEKKHVAPTELFADPGDYLYLSFDFNRNPATCSVIQWPNQQKVQVIESIKIPKAGTEAICDHILVNYSGYLYIVTGDYSGATPSSIYKEEVTNYTMIQQKLGLGDAQIMIEPNPRLEKNQVLVNSILAKYPVEICPVKGKGLIFDLKNVKKRADGTILKKDRDDPTQQADLLDTFRYWCNKFMGWFIKTP
jgi:phage terminase large subunit